MVEAAGKRLEKEIAAGKVKLHEGSVEDLPYGDGTFDAVFHCNCYYFWPDQVQAAAEIFRVMKPNAWMVTTINLAAVKDGEENGRLKYGEGDCNHYMAALQEAGFKDVRLDELNDNGYSYQAIYAYVGDKSS